MPAYRRSDPRWRRRRSATRPEADARTSARSSNESGARGSRRAGPVGRARRARADRDRTALGARRRRGTVWRAAAADADATVRRRAAELAPGARRAVPVDALVALLGDDDPLVAEAAAFALGEHPGDTPSAIAALEPRRERRTTIRSCARPPSPRSARSATRARSPVVLAACDDKPAVRRRAVLALAAFDGPEVEARLRAALDRPRLAGAPSRRRPARPT